MHTLWYEVWADDSSDPPYILLLCADADGFQVMDPREHNRVLFRHSSLDAVRNFLLEDEYTRVDGRTSTEPDA